jgi:hypothetical protein
MVGHMLQNREVAGATMGAGRRPTAVTFGPFGYLGVAVPVVLAAVFLPIVSFGVADPFGLRWSWLALLFVVANLTITRFAGGRGAEGDALWRSGPRDLVYRTQKYASVVLLGLVVIAFVGFLMQLPVFVTVVSALAVGVTVGVAPVFFLRRERGDAD